MEFVTRHRLRSRTLAAAAVLAIATPLAAFSTAYAGPSDRDGDGMPNRWESRYGLNAGVSNARGDQDRDGLTNLAEFRLRIDPSDEDTDDDGHDDRDELRDGSRSTDVRESDTDDDGVEDGDEDSDRDGVDNEDEDDARESCRADDDDDDEDGVDDEDENELDLEEGDSDSDEDGIEDGDEDADEDGEANEDMDDALGDRCGRDGAEDDGDLLGTIVSFDSASGTLTVDRRSAGPITFRVTADTEVDVDGAEEDGSAADLVPGALVAEVDVDGETGALEEIELVAPGMQPDDI